MWLTLLARFWFVIPILALGASTMYYRADAHSTRTEFDLYKQQIATKIAEQKADALKKEADDAKKISDAVSGRNDALSRLRQASASARRVPLTPAATSGSSEIIFDQKALDAAVERYRGRVRQLVIQGDEAQIDAQTLLQSWPTAQPVK
jgi:hypothetical protein